MPTLITVFGYHIYFWSNEGYPLEPVHVHISTKPHANATKVWILSNGSVELENNNSQIKQKDLKHLLRTIEQYAEDIVQQWEKSFGVEAVFVDLNCVKEER